jgi:hypothetical protein
MQLVIQHAGCDDHVELIVYDDHSALLTGGLAEMKGAAAPI